MLENLRGELDEVACDMGARNAWIDDVREHAVQRVSEFMKERARIGGA